MALPGWICSKPFSPPLADGALQEELTGMDGRVAIGLWSQIHVPALIIDARQESGEENGEHVWNALRSVEYVE